MNKFVAFMPARGGSKSIPLKNIKLFCGKPLMYWGLKAAQDCRTMDRIVVSTDSPQIAETVRGFAFPKVFITHRSPETATDTASTESALLEFAEQDEFENVLLIQATSPLLAAKHLDEGTALFLETKADSLVSGVRQKRFIWQQEGSFMQPVNYNPQKRPRRQDWDGFFVENGAFYITKRERLLASRCRISGEIAGYEMPAETYFELDEPADWLMAEHLKDRQIRQEVLDHIDFRGLNLLICDVDGVLTDAGLYYFENQEVRKFSVRDGKGLELLKHQGLKIMILTSEDNPEIRRRAQKLNIDFLHMGVKNKRTFLEAFFNDKPEFNFGQTAYIGDDVNDLENLRRVGFSAAPGDAEEKIQAEVHYICRRGGGRGCVREICDLILSRNV